LLVIGGRITTFSYVAFDRNDSLYIAATIVDVTSGVPIISQTLVPLTNINNGIYTGQFTPISGKYYLVICTSYTDATYTVVDYNRPPSAEQYDTFVNNNLLINFNYAAYDLDDSIEITAHVYNITDSTLDNFSMTHVALGVYFGQYNGVENKEYLITKIPTDTDRSSSSEQIQCFYVDQGLQIELFEATLIGQELNSILVES
jgi:hypothetical protein